MPDLQTFDLPNQEIFAAGTWNGDHYDVGDLDKMVEAYQATQATYKPKLKLTHDHPKGWPAVGFMDNVRRMGNKLMADFKAIPKKVYDMIQAGGFDGKSAEVLWNTVVGGQKFPYMLKAVALLGVDPKAVDSISDMMATIYASDGGEAKAYRSEAPAGDSKTYDLENKEDTTVTDMEKAQKDLAEANGKLAVATDQVATFSKENDGLKTQLADANKRADGAEAKVKEYAEKEVSTRVTATIEKLVTDKKMAPANKDKAYALLRAVVDSGTEKKYKLGDKELGLEEITVDLLGASGVTLPTDGKSYAGKRQDSGKPTEQDGIVNEDLAEKAMTYAKEKGVSYREALRALAPEEGK